MEAEHSELEKMLSAQWFDPTAAQLRALREQARLACARYNAHPSKGNLKHITRLFQSKGRQVAIEPGFQCDYGTQVSLGENVFINFNCVLLDSAPILIGDHVLLGPGVHIYTVDHPREVQLRRQGLCVAKPVVIESDAWIGAGAKILPGVTIGEGAIVGANALVRHDVPAFTTFY